MGGAFQGVEMKTYKQLWINRSWAVDCYICGGDIKNFPPDPDPCPECSMTGLEAIPWTELFSGEGMHAR